MSVKMSVNDAKSGARNDAKNGAKNGAKLNVGKNDLVRCSCITINDTVDILIHIFTHIIIPL